MFSEHLYRHTFDIDTLLQHWCTLPLPTGMVWQLNSETGEITQQPAEHVIENQYTHIFTPLPFKAMQQELQRAANTPQTAPELQVEIQETLAQCHTMVDLYAQFETTYAGGWFRQYIKNIILDWLDERDMIPPSMRHVRVQPTEALPLTTTPPKKVTIQ